ncbi:hypothetical protein OROGR_019097 [Orobanche gracilis]
MLQRAASNAYSWWWASHIRTKQSKWLEQCLQDMEDKVQSMLKLIEEDGDSFAKRAEMYYKRRPELITTVEESYKAFRALADRYDLLSKELQNANHTIATVFPEQVQFAMSEEEDDVCPTPNNIHRNAQILDMNTSNNVPRVPKGPKKDLKTIISKASKQFRGKRTSHTPDAKSGLTKDEALEEINKIQKDILALQTVKEFVKSSYESGVAKYWGIENQIMELQQKVSRLQDEFDMDMVIEDDVARTLMAEAALRSCQETLAMLQEKQEKSSREAKEEYKRIEVACRRLRSLRQRYMHGQVDEKIPREVENEEDDLIKESNEVEISPENNKESLDYANLTVTQLAEKIDQLVSKVIGLETAVSSQTVLVNALRTETDDLNEQICNLEEQNKIMIDGTCNLSSKVKEMEGKLNKIQDLNKNVESQNNNLETNFAEARSNLDCLTEKLCTVKPDEEVHKSDSSRQEAASVYEENSPVEIKNQKDMPSTKDIEDVKEVTIDVRISDQTITSQEEVNKSIVEKPNKEDAVEDRHFYDHVNGEKKEENTDNDEDMNWQQMLLSGMEDREKILLKEYTTILRNYKDVKKKLGEMEKKEKDSQFDTLLQTRELKKAIQKRDDEIRKLRQRLISLQDVKEENTTTTTNSDQSCTFETRNENMDASHEEDVNNNNPVRNEDVEDEIKLIFIDRTLSISKVEEKLRTDIDAILDENLDFWLRFSTEFHQIQKFRTQVEDLGNEISKLKEKRKAGDASSIMQMKSDVRPIYKHLHEIQREVTVWLEQSASLKDELKRRFSSLCGIQEEITEALKDGVEEDEIKFSSHQAAKFQGEVLNMKQENNKVREELRSGLDQALKLQLQIEHTLRKLSEEFGISNDQTENMNRPRVPLRSFLFGTKQKKQKHSIFSCMHPGRRYQILRTSIRLSSQNH